MGAKTAALLAVTAVATAEDRRITGLIGGALILLGVALGTNAGGIGQWTASALWRLRRAPRPAPAEPLTDRQLSLLAKLWAALLCVVGLLAALVGLGAIG